MPGAKKIVLFDNTTVIDKCVFFGAEFFGTYILVFLGCLGCVPNIKGVAPPHEQIALTFGLAVMLAIQCFGHISGGHINPIVTVAAAVLGHIALIQVPIYFVAQLLGALAGYGTVKIIVPSEYMTSPGGVCSPGGWLQGGFESMLMEFILSFMLVLICGAIWDWKNLDKHDSVTIRLGLAVAVLAMAGGSFSGSNMNPARSFAPALINGNWKNHWAYWVGPLLAGLLGGALYRFAFTKEQPKKTNGPESIPLNEKA